MTDHQQYFKLVWTLATASPSAPGTVAASNVLDPDMAVVRRDEQNGILNDAGAAPAAHTGEAVSTLHHTGTTHKTCNFSTWSAIALSMSITGRRFVKEGWGASIELKISAVTSAGGYMVMRSLAADDHGSGAETTTLGPTQLRRGVCDISHGELDASMGALRRGRLLCCRSARMRACPAVSGPYAVGGCRPFHITQGDQETIHPHSDRVSSEEGHASQGRRPIPDNAVIVVVSSRNLQHCSSAR
jgi:hypothetical protein